MDNVIHMKDNYKTELRRPPSGPLLILKPNDWRTGDQRTGILWIHGGGYITGMKEMVHWSRAVGLVMKFGAFVAMTGDAAVMYATERTSAEKTPFRLGKAFFAIVIGFLRSEAF